MRNTTLKSLFLCFISLSLACFPSCVADDERTHTEISLMLDVTEPAQNLLKSNFEDFYLPIGNSFAYTRGGSGQFNLQFLNNLGKSKVISIAFPAPGTDYHHTYYSNEYQVFHRNLRDTLLFFANQSFPGSNQSRIFEPMCRELNRLINLPDHVDKLLIIVSDFLENQSRIDFYHDAITNRTYQALCMANKCSLPDDLSGVEIWLIDVRNEKNVERVQAAQAFFKAELQKRHATVNLELYQQKASTN